MDMQRILQDRVDVLEKVAADLRKLAADRCAQESAFVVNLMRKFLDESWKLNYLRNTAAIMSDTREESTAVRQALARKTQEIASYFELLFTPEDDARLIAELKKELPPECKFEGKSIHFALGEG